ncbi:serine hydrolase domain-containing protein [Microtetraspora fusca]|uniref:Serine hydrolase domain-containing protein n=1 Tax=Microtetraspora fusca TaxID=1997 RepID=A0ABW6UYK1_MICFU
MPIVHRRRARAALLAALILPVALASATPAFAAPAAGGDVELRQALEQVVARGSVGAFADVRDENGHWAERAGTARLGGTQPVPHDPNFRMGSTTKSFVATVVLQLVGEGRLSLEDPVERWLPGVVPNGDGVTVRQLLNHTSGLYDYSQDKDVPLYGEEFLRNRYHTYTAEELVRLALRNPPYFAPGKGWRYSNTNYFLAGMIIKKVTGSSYGEEITRRILRPLGLGRTVVPGTSPAIPGRHAHGYMPLSMEPGATMADVTRFNPSVAGAAGEMISSAGDIQRFFAALLQGKLLRPAQLAEMTRTVDISHDTGVPGLGYGLGLEVRRLSCGVDSLAHGGSSPGFHTYVGNTRDGRRQVVLSVTGMNKDESRAAAVALVDTLLCGKNGRS